MALVNYNGAFDFKYGIGFVNARIKYIIDDIMVLENHLSKKHVTHF